MTPFVYKLRELLQEIKESFNLSIGIARRRDTLMEFEGEIDPFVYKLRELLQEIKESRDNSEIDKVKKTSAKLFEK